jgi:hypothetical protein
VRFRQTFELVNWNKKLVQNGTNAIQALTTNEIVVVAKHFYLDENGGH